MIPDISLAMDYVRELHPRDLIKLIERIESLLSDTYECKFGKTTITLDGSRNRIWIESIDYGHYTYAWGRPGTKFKEFLVGLNKHYVLGKFQIREVYDNRSTFAQLRLALKELDLIGESEFNEKLKESLKYLQAYCSTSAEFIEAVDELSHGSIYHYLKDSSIRFQFEDILSEPWNFICTKESVTARKLWKDFEKLQSKLREEEEA